MCQKAAQEWRIIMGILTRFKDIMSANINALLDKCEDPEKMIDQYMRNLESDLGKVKAETASVMAEETRCKRIITIKKNIRKPLPLMNEGLGELRVSKTLF